MKFVFAIGNPGKEYENTYHSLGLLYAKFLEDKFEHELISTQIQPKYELMKFKQFVLLKSKVYMNHSFQALAFSYRFYKFLPEDLIVLHDDLTLGKYEIKFKQAGGLRGHNGLRDIAKYIGQNFSRIQIGIGHPKDFNPKLPVDRYVLAQIDDIAKYQIAFQDSFALFKKALKVSSDLV